MSAFVGRGRELRQLVSIVGEEALSDEDRRILAFVDDFERHLVGQGRERRSIEQTLDLAWQLLSHFPHEDLKRVPASDIEHYGSA